MATLRMRLTTSTLVTTFFLVAVCTAVGAEPGAGMAINSWRGITPLRSSALDVARELGLGEDAAEGMLDGPFQVEGGEVTFSYLTPSLAKIYRAPKTMVGKVFTIYFKPIEAIDRAGLKLSPGFKRCAEEMDRTYYYFVNDAGLAYQLRRAGDTLETIIYQPSRAEVRRLAVSTACVF
jgi:hypothetical protein